MTMKRNRMGLIAALTLSLLLTVGVLATVAAAQPQRAAASQATAQPRDTITQTITLTASQDNTLYASELGNISNGQGQYLFAGNTGNGEPRRALVTFDLSAVPADATVLSATLSLNMSKTIAGETAVGLYNVQQAWGEGASAALGEEGGGAAAEPGDATWLNTFYDTADWTTPGGDFDAVPLAATPVGGSGRYDWTSAEFLLNVQNKVADPPTNFGWLLMGDETQSSTAKRFDSTQNNEPANRPTLTLTYTAEAAEVFSAYVPFVLR